MSDGVEVRPGEVRTLAELRAGGVRVVITEQLVGKIGSATYDSAAMSAGTEEGLRDRIADLESQLATNARNDHNLVMRARAERDRLKDQLAELREHADALTATAAQRASDLTAANARERQARREMHLRFTEEQVQTAKEGARASEGARIRSAVRGIVGTGEVQATPDESWSETLARVIRQVRDFIDSDDSQ